MLRYQTLKQQPKRLLALTGLARREFEELLSAFGKAYTARNNIRNHLKKRNPNQHEQAWESYDNAKVESFIKTLMMGEVCLYEYENKGEAYSRIGELIEQVYNQQRLYSALRYVPPGEFEQSLVRSKVA